MILKHPHYLSWLPWNQYSDLDYSDTVRCSLLPSKLVLRILESLLKALKFWYVSKEMVLIFSNSSLYSFRSSNLKVCRLAYISYCYIFASAGK